MFTFGMVVGGVTTFVALVTSFCIAGDDNRLTEEHKRNAFIASALILYGALSLPTNSFGLLIAWFGLLGLDCLVYLY